MKRKIIFYLGLAIWISIGFNVNTQKGIQPVYMKEPVDSLLPILPANLSDFIDYKFKLEASLKFATHRLPESIKEWEGYRSRLKEEVIRKTGLIINHNLPLDIRETGTIRMKGYSIKKISFQTRPGIYATSNLYVQHVSDIRNHRTPATRP